MKTEYRTIRNRASAEMIERRSRFIAHVLPVQTEQEALAFINALRSEYYDATHNVYAYIIDENNICRYSDDGEPSGTAGIPVLDVLRKENLTNLCVVVTRYFGGILLGGGGLVRAYGASAKLGVDAGGIITRVLCDVVEVSCDYTLLGKLRYEAETRGHTIREITYTDKAQMYVYIKTQETDGFLKAMCEASNGRAICKTVEQDFLDL